MTSPITDIPQGRIDIHCHLIPGVDDGCADIDETITCIRALQAVGYVGSICTPHIWHREFPENIPVNIRRRVDQLRDELAQRNIDYRLWPGGELRLFKDIIDWCKKNGVPTLADSKCVLVDFWTPQWEPWVDEVFRWLLDAGHTVIWAHPERHGFGDDILLPRMDELTAKGVLLQGNFQCASGEAGPMAQQRLRRWIAQGRYSLLAMDMHRPNSMHHRIDGLKIVEQEFGAATLDRLVRDNPRKLIFGQSVRNLSL